MTRTRGAGSRPSTARAASDLPEPLSPTRQVISSARSVRPMSCTAAARSAPLGRPMVRPRMSRTMSPPLIVAQPWVQGIVQPIADKVDRQHGEQDGDAGEGADPPGGAQRDAAGADQQPQLITFGSPRPRKARPIPAGWRWPPAATPTATMEERQFGRMCRRMIRASPMPNPVLARTNSRRRGRRNSPVPSGRSGPGNRGDGDDDTDDGGREDHRPAGSPAGRTGWSGRTPSGASARCQPRHDSIRPARRSTAPTSTAESAAERPISSEVRAPSTTPPRRPARAGRCRAGSGRRWLRGRAGQAEGAVRMKSGASSVIRHDQREDRRRRAGQAVAREAPQGSARI